MIRQLLTLFTVTASFVHALPPDAEALKAKRDAKIAEINRTYAAELEKMQKKAMDAGNLTAANEIQGELAAVVSAPFKNDPATTPPVAAQTVEDERLKPLIGVWKRDYDNGIWTITDTKGGVFNGSLKFTMSFDAEKNHVLVIGSHWADRLTFAGNPDVVNGSTENNGKTTRYRLKRIK